MAWHIEDTETEKLAADVAEMTGETKEVAVREALRERKGRLEMRSRSSEMTKSDLREFFEKEIWPLIPEADRGQPPMSKQEVEDLLGYEDEGR